MSLFLVIIAAASILGPLYYIIKLWRSLTNQFKIFGIYIFISVITEILTYILSQQSLDTRYIEYVFVVLEFGLLAMFLVLSFDKFISEKILWFVFGSFLIYCLIVALLSAEIATALRNIEAPESLVLCSLSLAHYWKVFKEPISQTSYISNDMNNESTSMLWLSTGILLYFSLTFFVFMVLDSLPEELMYTFWVYQHNSILIFRNAIFTVGLWKYQIV